MELVNATPLPAKLVVGAPEVGASVRAGFIAAKATYRLNLGAQPVLDGQAPFPILEEDEPTELGFVPRDTMPRLGGAFEVVMLAAAYGPGGRPTTSARVLLSLGTVSRALRVTGDRAWLGEQSSRPVPFTRMPLTWDRAFGGTAAVEVDEGTFVDVVEPRNPLGRGFDPQPAAQALAAQLRCPPSYPRWDSRRLLPNLEDPAHLVTSPKDAPVPMCWATVPLSLGLHGQRSVEGMDLNSAKSTDLVLRDQWFMRSHPSWVLPAPPEAGAPVRIEGVSPTGTLRFNLPRLRVLFDYFNRGKTTTVEVPPQLLVLRPEERCFTVTYRLRFRYPFEHGAERSIRLRTENGRAAASAI